MTGTNQRIKRALDELSRLYPDWRFGQLVANVAYWANGPNVEAIWDVEDEQFLQAAEEHLKSRRQQAVSTKG